MRRSWSSCRCPGETYLVSPNETSRGCERSHTVFLCQELLDCSPPSSDCLTTMLVLGQSLVHSTCSSKVKHGTPKSPTDTCFLRPNDAQGTSAEPLVGAGSLDSQFEAFEKVVAQHPTVWEPSECTKSAFAKGVNWVRRNS